MSYRMRFCAKDQVSVLKSKLKFELHLMLNRFREFKL